MTARRWSTAFAAFVVILWICRVAEANSLSPYVHFWPGIISITLVYAFPASLLAAFIERPFLTTGGIKRRPLVLTLRANFVSTIIGILLIPIGYPALYAIGPLWCIAAFCIFCAVEIFCLSRFSQQPFSWGWAVGGNAISSVVLMILPPITILIRQDHYRLARALEPHEASMALSAWRVESKKQNVSFFCPAISR